MPNQFSDLHRQQALISATDRTATSISVVIVNYNSREQLRNCLSSIQSESWGQVIVADSVSSDGSAEMVRQDFPWVHLMLCPQNNGYGAAANLAIASCASNYVLLLNSDTVLKPGTLQTLNKYLDQHLQVAVAGPQFVNADGRHQLSCFEFPTPWQTLLQETSLSRFLPLSAKSVQAAQPVPWVLGAALAIRRVAFDAVGGFDESFFMYFEEVDLCYRLKQAGWQTHFIPEAVIMHIGGASTKHHRAAMLQRLYQSLCHFYRRHYTGREKLQLKFILTYLMFRNILKDTIRSLRSTMKEVASDNLSVWRSILTSVWSNDGWLKH